MNKYLKVDIICTRCGKGIALSIAYQYNYEYLCPTCAIPIKMEINKKYGLR